MAKSAPRAPKAVTAFGEREVRAPHGYLATPAGGSRCGVLVLGGSSGSVERERGRLLARHGVTALSIQWFGGPDGPPGICEVPLETFTAAVDVLRAAGAERIGVLGLSKGAEAGLLLAVVDPRIAGVVALSPTSLVWANVGPGSDGADRPYRSSWTWQGRPWPFVPYDDTWRSPELEGEPSAILPWYEASLRAFADRLPAARIPVERTAADLLLIVGEDDAMWPSSAFARELADRREAAAGPGRPVEVVRHAGAGHRPRFPGEGPAPASTAFRYGGTPAADAELGALAWPHVLRVLRGPAAG